MISALVTCRHIVYIASNSKHCFKLQTCGHTNYRLVCCSNTVFWIFNDFCGKGTGEGSLPSSRVEYLISWLFVHSPSFYYEETAKGSYTKSIQHLFQEFSWPGWNKHVPALVIRPNFNMPRFKDQRYAIKFSAELKKTGAEIVALLGKAYGDNTMPYKIWFTCWRKIPWRTGKTKIPLDARQNHIPTKM